MAVASSVDQKEVTMRRKDLRGAHVWIGACWFIRSWMVMRLGAEKMAGFCRFCKKRQWDSKVPAKMWY